jgi:cell division protein FtsB
MIAKRKKQKKSRLNEDLIFQVITIFLAVFFIWYLAVSNYRIVKKRAELTERIEGLIREVQTLEQEKQKLEAGISQTQKDVYWEERIREQGYVREGENQVVILKPEEAEKQETDSEQSFSEELFEIIKGFFERIIKRD